MSSYETSDYYNSYGYTPNLAANAVGVALFGLAWIIHTVYAIWYRQYWFGTALFIGVGLETGGYIGRLCSHSDPDLTNPYLDQIICLILAPAFTMGGVYCLLANFTVIYGSHFSVLRPFDYSILFITCDVLSIVIQAVGGGVAASALSTGIESMTGTHIMVAGIAFQVFSMSLFMFFCAWLAINIYRGEKNNPGRLNPKYASLRQKKSFKYFPLSVLIAVIAIYIRCIYRLIELAEGWGGNLDSHEPYFLVLDGLMLVIAVYALAFPHPGIIWGRQRIVTSEYGYKCCQRRPKSKSHKIPWNKSDFFNWHHNKDGFSDDNESSNTNAHRHEKNPHHPSSGSESGSTTVDNTVNV